jgi:hypothetical protein
MAGFRGWVGEEEFSSIVICYSFSVFRFPFSVFRKQ